MNKKTERPKCFWHKNRKSDMKIAKIVKPKASMPPLWLKKETYLDLSRLRPWRHFTTLLDTAVKGLHGVLGQKKQQQQNNKMGLRSIMSRRLCFGLLRTSLLFIEIILIFSHSLFFNCSWLCKWFDGLNFENSPPLLVGPALDYVTQVLFWLNTQYF